MITQAMLNNSENENPLTSLKGIMQKNSLLIGIQEGESKLLLGCDLMKVV